MNASERNHISCEDMAAYGGSVIIVIVLVVLQQSAGQALTLRESLAARRHLFPACVGDEILNKDILQ